MQLHYDIVHKGNIHLEGKSRRCQRQINCQLEIKLLYNYCTRSLLAGDTANVWEDIELRIYPDPFFTSFKISSMNKKAGSKIPLKPKAPFKWVFVDIIPSTAPQKFDK